MQLPCSARIRSRQEKRSRHILREIFADVPDMKDSFVQWKHLSNTERKEKDHESSRTTDKKKDAMALVTGKPVFMDDLAPKDCLIVKGTPKPACQCDRKISKDRCGKKGAGN